MPKLPSISPQELARALERDGFVLIRIRGSHHTYFNEKKNLVAVVPFHGYDVPKKLLCKILKDADLSQDELRDLL